MKDARGLNDSIIGQTFLEKELNNSDIIQPDYWKLNTNTVSRSDSNLVSIFFITSFLHHFWFLLTVTFKFTVIYFNRYFWQESDLSPGRCGEEKHIHWRQKRWMLFISNDSRSCCLNIQLFYWTVHPESTDYWKYLILR